MKFLITLVLALFSLTIFASADLTGKCKHINGNIVECQDYTVCDYGINGLHNFIRSNCVVNVNQCKTTAGIVSCQNSNICDQIIEDGYYQGRCAVRMVVPKPLQYKPCDKNVDPVCICRYGMSGMHDYQDGKCDVTPKMCKTNYGIYPCKNYDVCSEDDLMSFVDGDCALRFVQ